MCGYNARARATASEYEQVSWQAGKQASKQANRRLCVSHSQFYVLQKIARAILFEIQISTLIYIRIKHQHAATSIVVAISCHCYALIHGAASAAVAAKICT